MGARKNEIAELMQQKKEIEKKLKDLQEEAITIGRANFRKVIYPTGKVTYKLCVPTRRNYLGEERVTWWPVIAKESRDDCIDELGYLIDDLVALQHRLVEDEWEDL